MLSIAKLEQEKKWQATAEYSPGKRVAIMRTGKDKYQLFYDDCPATAYPSSVEDRRPVYSANDLTTIFKVARYKLLKGRFPE